MSYEFRTITPSATLAPTGLADRVRNWFSRDEDDIAPTHTPNWQEAVYSDVGGFLFDNRLDPTPDNYDLAYQYRLAANSRLVDAIRAEIARSGTIDADTAERIFSESVGPVSAGALAKMADQMNDQVAGLSGIARQSGQDADAFRSALEESCADGASPEPQSILDLTKSMIARTRVAEAQLRRATKELRGLRENLAEAKKFADVDPLTELANRRAFKRELEQAIKESRENGKPLALAFCDIDHFKRLNDNHGHETGDRVLRFIAGQMTSRFEKKGLVARFGGEEFVIMFPNTTAEDAQRQVDACRAELANRRIYSAGDGELIGSVTFSGGVTTLRDSDEMADVLRRADETLYRAKADGRNRILLG